MDPQAKRLTFLGDQLSADEAAIKQINHQLVVAGYTQALAAEKADNYARGNELMDRNGGAPVHWQDFYGRTARDFIVRDTLNGNIAENQIGGRTANRDLHAQIQVESGAYQVQRPALFNYVYHANDEQIAVAVSEIAAIGNQVGALLARRRQLETEQGSLWATIAFEAIGNRDISLRALYRDQLKAGDAPGNDNRPDVARIAAVRAAVIYLRTIDKAVDTLSDTLDTDQGTAYESLRQTLQQSEDALREASASFADTPGAADTEVHQMADIVAQARGIQSTCKDICDAYSKAIDADTAGEEGRKLLYRGTLQNALFTFAETVAQLDQTLTVMSKSWHIVPEQGVRSPDEPAAVIEAAPPPPKESAVAAQLTAPLPAPTEVVNQESAQPPPQQNAPQPPSATAISSNPGLQFFDPDALKRCQLGPDGSISSDKETSLVMKGTEGRDFIVSGELMLADKKGAVVSFFLREADDLHRYQLTTNGLRVKRILLEGKVVSQIASAFTFNCPRNQWIPFRFEVRSTGIIARLGDESGAAKGPLSTNGPNRLVLTQGGSVRNIQVAVETEGDASH